MFEISKFSIFEAKVEKYESIIDGMGSDVVLPVVCAGERAKVGAFGNNLPFEYERI